jgi:hypothetical protein
VGYQAYKSSDYFQGGGFLHEGDSIKSMDEIKEQIRQHLNCSGSSFETSEIVILSFSELPDSVSAYRFIGSDTAKWSYCEEPQATHAGIVIGGGLETHAGTVMLDTSSSVQVIQDWKGVKPKPSPIPDTLKPRHLIPYDSVSIFYYFIHNGDINPNWTKLKFKTKKCYEYFSDFGYKSCGSSWVIKDTMKLIKAMLYDLAEYNRMTFSLPPAIDTGSVSVKTDSTWKKEYKHLYYQGFPSPNPIPDTIPRPKYEYYYKLMIPVNKFSPPLDTITMVLQSMGKSLTVDQAEELRAIVMRQLTNFIGRPTVDSVRIELPKK